MDKQLPFINIHVGHAVRARLKDLRRALELEGRSLSQELTARILELMTERGIKIERKD